MRQHADCAPARRPRVSARAYAARMRTRLLLAMTLVAALFAFACSERETGDPKAVIDSCEKFPNLCELSIEDLRIRVGGALEAAGTYRITAKQDNLVLPRWGGSDGGTVAVDLHAGTAVAGLRRTGDGQYAVALDGDTFFKRETCPSWTRIQDGAEVLAPFVLTGYEISQSRVLDTLVMGTDSATLRVDLSGLGEVLMEIDNETGRPVRLWSETLTNNGKRLEWSFSGWGEPVAVPSISADRAGGPGGNPC